MTQFGAFQIWAVLTGLTTENAKTRLSLIRYFFKEFRFKLMGIAHVLMCMTGRDDLLFCETDPRKVIF